MMQTAGATFEAEATSDPPHSADLMPKPGGFNWVPGVSIYGVPKFGGWFLRENPNLIWMMTGGSPILRKPQFRFVDPLSMVVGCLNLKRVSPESVWWICAKQSSSWQVY